MRDVYLPNPKLCGECKTLYSPNWYSFCCNKLLSLHKVDYLHKPILFQYFDFNFIVLLTSHWDSMFKPETGNSDGTTAQQNSDICQPLHTLVLCQHLNASAALCRPSGWAGDAILKAVNTTREALARLYLPLQTKVRHNIPSGYMDVIERVISGRHLCQTENSHGSRREYDEGGVHSLDHSTNSIWYRGFSDRVLGCLTRPTLSLQRRSVYRFKTNFSGK